MTENDTIALVAVLWAVVELTRAALRYRASQKAADRKARGSGNAS